MMYEVYIWGREITCKRFLHLQAARDLLEKAMNLDWKMHSPIWGFDN